MGVRGKRELAFHGGLFHLVLPDLWPGDIPARRVGSELPGFPPSPTAPAMLLLCGVHLYMGVQLWCGVRPV